MPKALKDWQAFKDLKKTIDDFNESCPLLELMANKAMKLRHWSRIGDLTSHTFDVESDTFLLRNIMEAPLLKHKEDIEVHVAIIFANGIGVCFRKECLVYDLSSHYAMIGSH